MNKHKHTPGPWRVEECRSGFAVYAYKSGEAVVQTGDDEGRYGTIANEANARLIAAAPELLALAARGASLADAVAESAYAVLGYAMAHGGDVGNHTEDIRRLAYWALDARSAIRAAEGEG